MNISNVMAWAAPAGKLIQEVTSITLVNNTQKTVDTTVPANKIWILKNIIAFNPDDVARTVSFKKYKEAAKTNLIKKYNGRAITTGSIIWPAPANDDVTKAVSEDEILVEGNTIEVDWLSGGASAGGTDADGLVIEYLEIGI